MKSKQWDVFISHASEDKIKVAKPLADALRRAGIRVWIDQQELEIGDSLSEKIDEGLSNSHFGIVILSKAFFSKHWPKRELAGLRAREEDGRKIIIPIWHDVNKAEVAKFSPILSDTLAGNTDEGVENLIKKIVRVVFSHSDYSNADNQPSLVRSMFSIMENSQDQNVMADFVRSAFDQIDMGNLFGSDNRLSKINIGPCNFDIVTIFSGHGVRYNFSYLTNIWNDPFDKDDGSALILDEVKRALADVAKSMDYFNKNYHVFHANLLQEAKKKDLLYTGNRGSADQWYERFLRDVPMTTFQIFCGRRSEINRSDERTLAWGDLRKINHGIHIRSYDSIIDQIIRSEMI